MSEENALPEIDESIIEEAKKAYGLSEQNVNSILRHTIKQFHELVSELSVRETEDGPVAARVKGGRKKRRSAPSEPLIDHAATQAIAARRVSLDDVSVQATDDNAEWKLFLAALDDDVGLAELFPESEDEEYCMAEDEADLDMDDSEELRNDRAVRISRKEVVAIKRLADKNLDALLAPMLAAINPPAVRYVLNPAQRLALSGRVRDAVQLCAQLALHSQQMVDIARPMLQALAAKAHDSWVACTLPESRPSLFTPDLKHTLTTMLSHDPAPTNEDLTHIMDGWVWASRALLPLCGRKPAAERRSFLAVEDRLLVWGLQVFCPDGAIRRRHIWVLIHTNCLPVWEPRQIHLRYKNRTARHKPTNNIKEWKRCYVEREEPQEVFDVDVLVTPDHDHLDVDVLQHPPRAPPGPGALASMQGYDIDILEYPADVC